MPPDVSISLFCELSGVSGSSVVGGTTLVDVGDEDMTVELVVEDTGGGTVELVVDVEVDDEDGEEIVRGMTVNACAFQAAS